MSNLVAFQPKVFLVDGISVMLDRDLAQFYQTTTRLVNLARSRQQKMFEEISFKLSKREYALVLKTRNEKATSKYLPMVYTEEACYKLSYYLNSPVSNQVADMIFKAFKGVKEGKFLPVKKSAETQELENLISSVVENQLKGFKQPLVQNNFHAPVNYIQGDNTTLNIQSGMSESFMIGMTQLLLDKQVAENKELVNLIGKALSSIAKGDKKGLLDHLKTMSDLGSMINTIATGVPTLIKIVQSLF